MILELEPDQLLCGAGQILPLFPGEVMWGRTLRIMLYFFALVFCFLGIAIISDVFMSAIEVITSKEKTLTIEECGKTIPIRVFVWNDTIANLTLMALGSSAPEILLAVVEVFGKVQRPPDESGLGASTIVGSAAFNLLAITAICVSSIPNKEDGTPDVRYVKEVKVFMITSFFSIFAYLWMYFVVSDNQVTLYEAVITLFLFPIMVAMAFYTEKGCGSKSKVDPYRQKVIPSRHSSMASALTNMLSKQSSRITRTALEDGKIDHLAHDLASEMVSSMRTSPMRYRINAMRFIKGGKRVKMATHPVPENKKPNLDDSAEYQMDKTDKTKRTKILFGTAKYAVAENAGKVDIHIVRTGYLLAHHVVQWETRDGKALSGEDYDRCDGIVYFPPVGANKAMYGTQMQTISIPIIDDDVYEPDENFFVQLSKPNTSICGKLIRRHIATHQDQVVTCEDEDGVETLTLPSDAEGICFGEFELGPHSAAEVTIINDDDPGEFSFSAPSYPVAKHKSAMVVEIVRQNGCDGKVAMKVETIDGATAHAHTHFIPLNETIQFEHCEMNKQITIHLCPGAAIEDPSDFQVKFTLLNTETDGSKYGEICDAKIQIVVDETYQQMIDAVANQVMSDITVETTSWSEQFKDAMNCGGEEGEDPSGLDYTLHFLSLGWKVLFALVPPTSYCGGWLTFWVSLAFIGLLTAVVADVASTFGCLLGLPDSVTAISFVALGTSLPDMFASRTAAGQDPHADASVGNVTGSNSVNVFLGLGVPWCIATIYHTLTGYDDGVFRVSAGSLAFSIAVFCPCALVCLALLAFRRLRFGGELGGPEFAAKVTSTIMFSLWVLYVVISSLESIKVIDNPF